MTEPRVPSRSSNVLALRSLPKNRTARMVLRPDAFTGTLDQFYDRYVLPNLPLPDAVECFHRRLVAYCLAGDPLFLVRGVGAVKRGAEYLTVTGDRLRPSDNSPAWVIHYLLFYDLAVESFSHLMDGLPVHMFDVQRSVETSINAARWHVAHIFNARYGSTDFRHWSHEDVVCRFVRNIHPCNHFYVPLSNWSEHGGDHRVISYFLRVYERRYSAVWEEFLTLAQGRHGHDHDAGGNIDFSYEQRASAPRLTMQAGRGRAGATVTYESSRLGFRKEVIEALALTGSFRVVTPDGVFQMTVEDFRRDFANVVASRSYQDAGIYTYPTPPAKAERYRVEED